MAKCEKCGKEYPDGTEHVCSSPEEQKMETNTSQEKKATPEEKTQPQKTEGSTQEKNRG
ncbi:hypothetical protein HY772_02325 [Candidatus Woesearchaeota archaeon]|nr:hypothetical protein [Candidatus Woesearchaeota archaeon]